MRKYFTFYFIFTISLTVNVLFPLVCNAEETTYYNLEQIEVSSLPEASEVTMNKVYIYNGNYYVTDKIESSGELILGHNYKDEKLFCPMLYDSNMVSTILSNPTVSSLNVGDVIATGVFGKGNDIFNTIFLRSKYSSTWWSFEIINNSGSIGTYTTSINSITYSGLAIGSSYIFCNNVGGNAKLRYDFIINEIKNDYIFSFITSEPIVSYSWLQVPKSSVIDNMSDDDFYLFFDFDTISNFNILSAYDFSNFSDFQKLVIMLGFNMFFLGFIFFVIYVFLKLINKGYSLIFK